MNYLDYFKTDTIRPTYIFGNKNFEGGYLKPDWIKLLGQGINYVEKKAQRYKDIDKTDPTKNNKNTSNIIAPSIFTTIKYLTNGMVREGFPRSEWSVSNFTVAPIKGS